MFTYGNDQVNQNEFVTDFGNLGAKTMSDMGFSIPYYGLEGGWNETINIPNYSKDVCGGDCMEFFMDNFDMFW